MVGYIKGSIKPGYIILCMHCHINNYELMFDIFNDKRRVLDKVTCCFEFLIFISLFCNGND
jgi:hypothetical protein